MKKVKGTKDIFGKDIILKNKIFALLEKHAINYGFNKIETPIIEFSDVYNKSVGETSDIVSKEMYVFKDRKGREIVLRPEGTAGTVRAFVENKIYAEPQPIKLFYIGQMFRYENPQRGRQRQFNQFGVEVFGEKNPYIDVEVISLANIILKSLNIKYVLKINSLGDKNTRDKYSSELKKYFDNYKSDLEEVSLSRISDNPMRILDDKIESKKEFVKNAPKISDFYNKDSKDYFESLKSILRDNGIEFLVDEKLMRGLDYYTDTAFEFISTSDKSGSQNTIIGGGRYQNLVNNFGGPQMEGIGFGLGIERLINEVEVIENELNRSIDVYVLNINKKNSSFAFKVLNILRINNTKAEWNVKATKLKKAFDKATKVNSKINIIVGEEECDDNMVTIKVGKKQKKVGITDLAQEVKYILEELNENNK